MKLDVGPAITVPAWVILHPDLTPTAVRLYCLLACRLAIYGEGDQPTRRIMACRPGRRQQGERQTGAAAAGTGGCLELITCAVLWTGQVNHTYGPSCLCSEHRAHARLPGRSRAGRPVSAWVNGGANGT
jgi:hypothetical protein